MVRRGGGKPGVRRKERRRGKPTKTEEVKPRRAMRLKQSGEKCT